MKEKDSVSLLNVSGIECECSSVQALGFHGGIQMVIEHVGQILIIQFDLFRWPTHIHMNRKIGYGGKEGRLDGSGEGWAVVWGGGRR